MPVYVPFNKRQMFSGPLCGVQIQIAIAWQWRFAAAAADHRCGDAAHGLTAGAADGHHRQQVGDEGGGGRRMSHEADNRRHIAFVQ
ncbi:MAG: hypothetical protein KGJ55_11870 [Gammaproteobacteria bacterium]|nr:hypothetical protein [Gammaproteobacteria bacterium]